MLQNLLLHVCIVYPFHFEIIFSSSTEIQFWEKLCLNKNSPYPEFGPIKTGCLETTSEDVNWVEEHCRLRLNQLQEVWLVFFFFKIFPVKKYKHFFNLYFHQFSFQKQLPRTCWGWTTLWGRSPPSPAESEQRSGSQSRRTWSDF